jgi:hypothetical protein
MTIKQVSYKKKSPPDHCSNADGSAAYALSALESSDAYTGLFAPMNLPYIAESFSDNELYDEAPMPNKDRHDLIMALIHLRRISIFSNSRCRGFWLKMLPRTLIRSSSCMG